MNLLPPLLWLLPLLRLLMLLLLLPQVGVAYKINGKTLTSSVPASIEDLEKLEVVYETLPGWKSDISQARSWSDLPAAAQNYVEKVEQLVGVPIRWIGVGPGRDAIVEKH